MKNNLIVILCYFQVLSNSVAVALETQGNVATKSTQKFNQTFNKFFDILNSGQ